MWKFTGNDSSVHTSQNGFHVSVPRSGKPASSGFEHVTTPRKPGSWQRRASATEAAMSHHGMSAMPKIRWPDASCISAM